MKAAKGLTTSFSSNIRECIDFSFMQNGFKTLIILGQAKRQAPFRRLVIKIDCYQGCSSMDWIKFLRRLGRSGPGNNNLCFSVIDFDYNTAKEMPPNSFSILVAF